MSRNKTYSNVFNRTATSCATGLAILSIGYCKKDVNPLLTHWSYIFLASIVGVSIRLIQLYSLKCFRLLMTSLRKIVGDRMEYSVSNRGIMINALAGLDHIFMVRKIW